MFNLIHKSNLLRITMLLLVFALLLPMAMAPSTAYAKDGDQVFRGLVQAKPATGLVGKWVIGGKSYTATAATQFEQLSGPLKVGACAKVKIRNSRVHEISSEPRTDC